MKEIQRETELVWNVWKHSWRLLASGIAPAFGRPVPHSCAGPSTQARLESTQKLKHKTQNCDKTVVKHKVVKPQCLVNPSHVLQLHCSLQDLARHYSRHCSSIVLQCPKLSQIVKICEVAQCITVPGSVLLPGIEAPVVLHDNDLSESH